MTFETFDQSDEETWPDWKRPTYPHTHQPNIFSTFFQFSPTFPKLFIQLCFNFLLNLFCGQLSPNFSSIFLIFFSTFAQIFVNFLSNCQLLFNFLELFFSFFYSTFSNWFNFLSFIFFHFSYSKGAIIGTCDILDTDYNTDKWEPGFMTIFVTWQLIVTLDSIRNSCDFS